MKYYIDYGTGIGNEMVEGTLTMTKKIADEGICYTGKSCKIYLEDKETLLAVRHWHGTEPDYEEKSRDIIQFGTFGFYDEWHEIG